jgi:DNA-directed RNA polymerase subunit RPC12/RpoP
VIEFRCRNCHQKISVQDRHSGKRFKCSRCGSVGVVPGGPAKIEFCCQNCSQRISLPETYAGKKVRCPKCKNVVIVPTRKDKPAATLTVECIMCGRAVKVPETFGERLIECPQCGSYVELPSKQAPAAEKKDTIQLTDIPEESVQEPARPRQEKAEEKTEDIGRRKLPWPIDILLYPATLHGIVTICIIIVGRLSGIFCCFGWIIQILVYLYMYWYFCECIRDSAAGGLRAPITISREASLSEMFWQSVNIFVCCVFFFGPQVIYETYVTITGTPVNIVILWSLRSYGIFFFPMGVLAVVMFDSVNGLNPILIVRSIISTFFQYCGLVILFYSLAFLFLFGVMGASLSAATAASGTESILKALSSVLMFFVLINIIFIWIFFVAGHLLGRFYWKYQERLYWEV